MNPFRQEDHRQDHLIMSTLPSPLPSPKPTEVVQPSSIKAKDCKEWAKCGAWTLCATFLLICVAAGIFHFYLLNATAHPIHCYECIAIVGAAPKEPGLPYEEKCMTSPKNWRVCNSGEICIMVHVTGGGISRFHRSCTAEKKIGCSGEILTAYKTKEKYCYCNSDYCKN